MTLAVIFLNVSLALYSVVASAQASPQSANTISTQGQDATQPQNLPAQSQPSTSQPAQKSSTAPKKQAGQKTNYRKRVRLPDCKPAPAATSAPGDPSAKAPADAATGTGAKTPPAAPSTNCPPQKVIVRQGSTAEPSIQLVGGDATSQHEAADQMLAATDANLKKIEGTQLSSSQKDMVTQIRQFMDQSKKATADGDTEQARTLAWKAKTLSEELVAPPK